MPLPVIAGVARASVTGNVDGGGRWSNTWHFRREDLGTPDGELIAELAVALLAFYGSTIIASCTPGTTLDGADITPLDGSSGAFHYTADLEGAGVSNSMPAQTSMVLTIRTALRGRQNRGRVYFPPFGVSNFNADGLFLAAGANAITVAVGVMQAALLVLGWETGVASYGPYKNPLTGVTSDDPLVNGGSVPHFTEAVSFGMDLMADAQRGRKT